MVVNAEKKFYPFLDGLQIFLREVRPSDVNENYYRWMNDPEVTRYLETRYIPQSMETIAKFVESMSGKRDEIFLAICLRKDGRHVGNIKLGPINWIHGFADISLLVGDKSAWGKGIGTEAIRLVSRFAFDTLNLHKVRSGCYEDNEGSRRAFLKAGFRQEGVLKKQWRVNGEFRDEFLFGLCREEAGSPGKKP